MWQKIILSFVLVILVLQSNAQVFTLKGKVIDNNREPLAYVNVRVKDIDMGTTTDANGMYQFKLATGKYELVFTMVGYQQQTAIVIVNKADATQNIILLKDKKIIDGVKISATKKDYSEAIIKNTINAKDDLQKRANSYTVEMYIKAIEIKDSVGPKKAPKIFAKIAPKKDSTKIDSTKKVDNPYKGMTMAEIFTILDYQYPNKIKEVREGVKKYGDTRGLFFLTRTDGDFNFYRNLINAPALSEMSFLSPISNSGLIAYKFKTLAIFEEKGIKYYRIKATPYKSGNALVEGEFIIQDGTWALTRAIIKFPKHLTPEYTFFQVEQNYTEVADSTWLIDKQVFTYKASADGKSSGSTTVTFKNYNLDTIFSKKHFGNELSTTTVEAYDRDSTFWNNNRAEPLTEKEVKFIQYKDSVYQATHSKSYLDSIDKITNKITWKQITYKGITNYKRSIERRIQINPLISMYQPFFLGGTRIGQGVVYYKQFKNKKTVGGFAFGSYGLNNKDVLGTVNIFRTYNPFNQGRFNFTFGSNFDFIFNNDAIIGLISRSNVYKKNNLSLEHRLEIFNGLFMTNTVEFARRISLYNYKTVNRSLDTLFGRQNKPIEFDTYDALYNVITFSYTPKQQYIRDRYQKLILGSKYPTFYAKWRFGVPNLLGSKIDFHYIEIGLDKKVNLGTAGIGNLNAYYGNFIQRNKLLLVDYKWVRRGDPYVFFNPERNFQALDSTFAVFKGFYEGHYYHQFNGAIINKIPYAKVTGIVESAGSSFLIVPERNLRYIEFYAGLEKSFKILGEQFRFGAYAVYSYANTFKQPLQWKFGIRHYNIYTNKWE
jgi:hypothetical protein